MTTSRCGMTLVEVLLAAMLLGIGMLSIFTCLSKEMRLIQASRDVQRVMLVFDLVSVTPPLPQNITTEEEMGLVEIDEEPAENLFSEDDRKDELKGFVVSRKWELKEKPEDEQDVDDHLFTLVTTVSWGERDDERQQIVELFWIPDLDEWTGK